MSHNYDRMCGCDQCSRYEESAEDAPDYRARLALLPNVIAEVVFSDDEAAAISRAAADGDNAEIGRLFLIARDRYVAELIERRGEMYNDTLTDDEAAERLCEVYS